MEKGWEKNRKTSKTQEKRKEEENTLLSLMIEEDPAGVSFETPRGLTPQCAEIHPMGRTQLRRELLTVFRIPSLRMLQPPFRKFSNPARQRTWPKSCEKQNKEEEDHAIDPSILLGCCFETPCGAWETPAEILIRHGNYRASLLPWTSTQKKREVKRG